MGRGTCVHHPLFARLYPLMGKAMERGGMAEHHQALLARLTGEVIEVGAGDGLNFPHYPATVTRVLGVEPEPHLRSLARAAAGQVPVPVEVVDGIAEPDTAIGKFEDVHTAVHPGRPAGRAQRPTAADRFGPLFGVVRPRGRAVPGAGCPCGLTAQSATGRSPCRTGQPRTPPTGRVPSSSSR
ncbi:class I SAM-dependent methyltransferase [Streptomyces ureilyticus]|uniref:Methyltransferase type 11 domain-containing protein n=1 Tax=Streptomyces ureilyticus TaxID=1775131 RepID=A0ABX0DZV7_9ACTN|nr:hypothetical protein [Streptomyces ureilyticus]